MDLDNDTMTVLATLRAEVEDKDETLASLFYVMEDLWERKLWHQLTETLRQVYATPASQPIRLPLFERFIASFETKINQLAYVTFALAAASSCPSPEEVLRFLEKTAAKVDKPEASDAYVYARIEIARAKINSGDLIGAREILDEASTQIDQFRSVDSIINAALYSCNSEYYKAKADFTAYYHNALLYLACIDASTDLTLLEQQERAYDLAVAALLGDKIFNFGELLLHPILDSLKDTPYAWLCALLVALNSGDVKAFEQLSSYLPANPLLEKSLPFLRQKICLTALSEAVFQRPSSSRTLTFDTIATETHLVKDEVEHLVMKALSLGLMKGLIDEVAQTVTITWLQPRVLNKTQVESMRARLESWNQEVSRLGSWMETSGDGLWTGA